MENEKILSVIPQAHLTKTFGEFFRLSMNLLRVHISPEFFKDKVQALGIQSRVSYRQVVLGKRKFPDVKIPQLSATLDLSFRETVAVAKLNNNKSSESGTIRSTEYVVGFEQILSSPLHTIVLNLCGLNKKMKLMNLRMILQNLFTENEIEESVQLLLKYELLFSDAESNLTKLVSRYQMSTVPGVKLSSAKAYIEKSLMLAEKNYDLPLESREYAAFTARIKKEDFLKVKDLVRNFRKSIYELSTIEESDAITHVNINAFVISPNLNQK